jgi:hypothetical protein
MKKLIVIIGLVCWGKVFSQNDSACNPQINQMSLQHFIETCFQEKYKSSLNDIGLSGICYARFQVTTDGQLKDIQVSPGTNEVLAAFITTALQKTSGYWNYDKSKDLPANEYIVLPIEYNLQKDGNTTKSVTEPQALLSFFSPAGKSNSVKLVFLKSVEYTSPFDNKNNWKKVTMAKQNL